MYDLLPMCWAISISSFSICVWRWSSSIEFERKKMAVSFNETCGYRIGFWQVFLCWRSWSIKFSRSVPILGVESITQPLSMVVQCLLLYCALCQECLILKTISFLFIYTNMKINIIKKNSHLDFWPVSLY